MVELQTAQQFFEWKEYPEAMASAKRLIDNQNGTITAATTAAERASPARAPTGIPLGARFANWRGADARPKLGKCFAPCLPWLCWFLF